jgi:hypothetical protein
MTYLDLFKQACNDKAVRRGWRKGFGISLALWVVGQIILCTVRGILR